MKIYTTRLTGAAWILVTLFWATGNLLWAAMPQQTINGTVTDTQQNPIPGVSIRLLYSNTGTQTDMQGTFSLSAQATDTLLISYIGFKTLRLRVGTQTRFSIQLQQDITTLGEVTINAGYYNTTRREQTGNIARVTAAEIERQPVTNPLAALQGRMPGVFITQNTGVPGGAFQIQIRGQNSLRAEGNAPLYIIDGVPISSDDLGDSRTAVALPGGVSPLNSIDPNAIASIEVLKDADATAIYGSRGANGVVLITTKKGSAGSTQFNLGYRYGISTVQSHLELLNTQEYLEVRREAYANDGITEYPANAYDVNGTWDPNRYTDWQEVIIGNKAKYLDINGSLSGGTEHLQFRLGGNYHRETTVYPGDYAYNKIGVQTRTSYISTDNKFNASLSGNFTYQTNNLPEMATLMTNIYQLPPNAPALYKADGSLNWEGGTWQNPFAVLENNYNSDSYNLIMNTQLSYQLVKGLELKTSLGYTNTYFLDQYIQPSTSANPAFGYTPAQSSIRKNQLIRNSWILEPQLSYTLNFNDFKIQSLVGSTFQSNTASQLHLFGLGFSSNRLIKNLSAADRQFISTDTETNYKYIAVFGRVNFSLRNRYFLNLTARRDGSSRFGPGKQFSNFGAVGASWIFSSENGIRDLAFLSFGKLRGSYGITGNDQIGDYQYLDTYSLSASSYNETTVLEPSRLFNPDFSWEMNKKLELALETGFFKDRLLLTAAWYRNRSSNQLVGIPLAGTTGFSLIQANLDATIENRGWEFTLQSKTINKADFSWESTLNLSITRNELLAFPDLESSTYSNRYVIGEPLNIRKTYNYEGLDPETGLYQFTDYNEDGQLTFQDDREGITDLNPVYYGGFQNSLRYKGFTLDFLFQFVKQQNYNALYSLGQPGRMGNTIPEAFDRWQQTGDQSTYQAFSTGANRPLYLRYLNYNQSNAMITDASYIRLKTLALSYSLPENLIPGVNCRITVQGQNLLTITDYKGFDPESIYPNSLPPLQVFTTGVQLNF